ncbi:formylglycine-generating enzyme family protein [Mobilicoccus caccae]|uniref:Sulfatase-modifying factor enzyme-like domain-containing protein n=1 Tax=Mobilicoccus caccae TaxID=1859295 RepID=A0ABQ6IKL9_9MICO|nr:SUMF1/EgtB/PvdO family nonheme iron enzyme [Mobilicoccus caccae]GMA38239.1 hypothetical protein GCM10025883_02840 [Mobilicoccus caccae]
MPIDMVRVPPQGPVAEAMVDRRTGRTWTVEVDRFEIATTVVTVDQWNTVRDIDIDSNRTDLPKVDVGWRAAIAFCNELSLQEGLAPAYAVTVLDPAPQPRSTWTPHDEPVPDDWDVAWDREANGYRLPTDAEWQLACRAGTSGARYGDLDEIGWYADNSDGARHRVGEKRPNAWGLFDMLGGVWEWCWDLYDPQIYGSYRIIRGGGWSDPHWACRAGVRRKTNPRATFDDLGFRLARTITP